MNDRKLQERCDWGDIKTEWENSSAVNVRNMSNAEVTAWVKNANRANKLADDCTRYRSISDDSGTNW